MNYHADEVLLKDCEMSSLHQCLSGLPTEMDINTWEEIIKRALYLFENHPPDTLEHLNEDWKIKWLKIYLIFSKRKNLIFFLVNILRNLLVNQLFEDILVKIINKYYQNNQIHYHVLLFGV